MKHPTATFLRLAMAGLLTVVATGHALAEEKSVAATAIVDHPALDLIRDGILAELKASGFTPGKNLKWQSQTAQGNPGTAAQIARKFVGDGVNVIVPISTPSAQAVAAATKDIPVVYAAVSDPIAAGLVKNWKPSGTNVTGVADVPPLDKQLSVIQQAAPHAKRIGVIYNPGEANSESFITSLKDKASSYGYTVVEAAAPRSVDVGAAAKSLIGKVDLIFEPTDNTVASAFASVIKVGTEAKIPVFASDKTMVEQGAAMGLALNYAELGRQTGKLVVRILKGEQPGSIASQVSTSFDLYVNTKAAKAQGLNVPEDMVKNAKIVNK